MIDFEVLVKKYPTKYKDFRNCHLSRKKAIRIFCLECVDYNRKEVRNCSNYNCSLYPYRMGKKEKGSELIKTIGEGLVISRINE